MCLSTDTIIIIIDHKFIYSYFSISPSDQLVLNLLVINLNLSTAFLIGSIEEVNRKISRLDRKLQSYTDLVVESRSSDQSDGSTQTQLVVPGDHFREMHQQRGDD